MKAPTSAGGAARAGGAAGASPVATTKVTPSIPVTDQAVMDYLKSKGMGKALMELTQKIKEEQQQQQEKETPPGASASGTETSSSEVVPKITREQLESAEENARTQRTVLVKSTGGGFGYDRDAAAPIAMWGVPDSLVVSKENGPNTTSSSAKGGRQRWAAGLMGEREAKSYLDAFVALQLWILSLPDDSAGIVGWQPKTTNVIAKAKALIDAASKVSSKNGSNKDNDDKDNSESSNNANNNETKDGKSGDNDKGDANKVGSTEGATTTTAPIDVDHKEDSDKKVQDNKDKRGNKDEEETKNDGTSNSKDNKNDPNGDDDTDDKKTSSNSNILSTVISELAKPMTQNKDIDDSNHNGSSRSAVYPIPPSAKAELLSVSFALLVHTYCELLEVGMESTAHVLRDAFKPIYDPLPSGYGTQYADLYRCVTTEDMSRLNNQNSQHMEAVANLKTIVIQVAGIQTKKRELENGIANASYREANADITRQNKILECEHAIGLLQQKHTESTQRATLAYDKMYDVPFLRRVRALRWQLTLSTTSYGMLCQFLNSNVGAGGSNDTSLLAMSTLLQTKCELHVEQRNPLPFTPAVVLEDDFKSFGLLESESNQSKNSSMKKEATVQWAAPVKGLSRQDPKQPFPKFNLDNEYENELEAKKGKRSVEFNRSLIINGFRRLEALERKRDFQAMSSKAKEKYATEATVRARRVLANPLEPSIMFSTLCANQTRRRDDTDRSSNDNNSNNNTSSFLWEESGIGITCAKLCSPDGRRMAVGCDDSAIRVWNLMDDQHKGNGNGSNAGKQMSVGDAGQVLLGHKNGFPVFDLSWNRDGRSLLSAGGDGSIRLWDTSAQGPFGEVIQSSNILGAVGPAVGNPIVVSPTAKKPIPSTAAVKETLMKATENLEKNPDMSVSALRPESKAYTSGAALAVYRGHAPNTPIWSVAFSPSGYYFASGGSDATARLWTTDRSVPVRIFTGHTSNCIHSVVFHPNCNYVLSGSEDKTVRLWDIQTGQCVRLLNGCPAGIYKVDVDPSGQYAVGADLLGTVHVWDLGTGKKVTELRSPRPGNNIHQSAPDHRRRQSVDMVHSFAFSPCGRALATGGDDRTVRIWDIRKAIESPIPVLADPVKSFTTRRTVVMDLQYTKRNLLLSVGKYISAI